MKNWIRFTKKDENSGSLNVYKIVSDGDTGRDTFRRLLEED